MIRERSLSKPKRHERSEVLSFPFGSDGDLNVAVNKTENFSCGERYLVMDDVVALFPQVKDDGLNRDTTKSDGWKSLRSSDPRKKFSP